MSLPKKFTIKIDEATGVCPSGEKWAEEKIQEKAIPVLSCEGPCIRGEIARLSANIVAKNKPYARACYAETALVPYSGMAKWVKNADKIIMIDGCFLNCIGRLINNLADRDKILHIDALPLYKKYTDVFHMDDVTESERIETAKIVAEKIQSILVDGEGKKCSCSKTCGN